MLLDPGPGHVTNLLDEPSSVAGELAVSPAALRPASGADYGHWLSVEQAAPTTFSCATKETRMSEVSMTDTLDLIVVRAGLVGANKTLIRP